VHDNYTKRLVDPPKGLIVGRRSEDSLRASSAREQKAGARRMAESELSALEARYELREKVGR
jgi:hypothetical protein